MSKAKEIAGRQAADMVETGSTVGLGTGSTVYFTLVRLAERIRDEGLEIRGVPTSIDTETKAREMGIPLTTLAEVTAFDVTIDGADEIDTEFQMIKGGGGALLREKVVAYATKKQIIIVGRDKLVERLGTTFDLPVEVVPFAMPLVAREIERLGGKPVERTKDGAEYRTDNGNAIFDVHFDAGIDDAAQLEKDLDAVPGVVESGLFIGLAHVCVVGDEDGGCEVRER